jgi:uncharacterized Ntn-hydrolase superfamily protein
MQLNTFSIVAYDPDENAWGVAVASKFLAAAALVSHARAGAGAIATQAFAKVSYGPDGLDLLEQGLGAGEVLNRLLESDPKREQRQIGIVDADGQIAAHTGSACSDWAGHRTGTHFSVQGNILTGEEVIDAMAEAFLSTRGELADRLVAALRAAENAGGDKRGKQAAGLLVVKPGGGYGGDTDRYIDLRVDDHDQPVKKLRELLQAHHLFFGEVNEDELLTIDEDLARELQNILVEQGYMGGEVNGDWDEVTKQAFWVLIGNENLEERWNLETHPDKIDRTTLQYIRRRFG